ncbi:ABC transporter ATP-binding protein [Pacificibacter sp. AS14]|uniref:ABC transporter ATP-binding protein n=1 Tax=Alphaproteobacteria TaxID=28211 RepID=UPI00318239FC
MSAFLDVENLHAGYGTVPVLRGVSIRLDQGESIGLFGPNGHGKTTLLRCISGLLPSSQGTIRFDGVEITKTRPSDIVAQGLVHAQQGNTLFGDMGVAETLALSAFVPRARKTSTETLEYVYELFPRLAERRKQLAKTLSGGERQMLSIGCALMCNPRLLILDEPTLGLSPKLKQELCDATAKIAARGIPLIIVEQDVDFLLTLTDRLYLIDHGTVEREIAADNAPDHAEIVKMYFGAEDA